MFINPDLVSARHADLLRQADEQRLARLVRTPRQWHVPHVFRLMVNWLQQERLPQPTAAACGEVICC